MTKEEAIERLKHTDACDSELCEVIDIAIKSLEKDIKQYADPQEVSEEEAYSFPEVFGEPIEMLIDGIWMKGKVINDYRSRDGIVNMETADGKKYWCGCERKDCYRRPKEDKE